jgi:hypothetical protein
MNLMQKYLQQVTIVIVHAFNAESSIDLTDRVTTLHLSPDALFALSQRL